jgi:hypothetical protein
MRICLALLLCLLPAAALPWGATGHRVTGALAEPLLDARTRAAVTGLLGVETLAEASTWADEMRSNPAPFWQDTAGPWHYVTVPEALRYRDAGAPEEGDAFSALERFRGVLRDPDASMEERRLALRFAVHIIGDLHQPLHAGNGTDRGGNDFEVRWFREPGNLHRVWDSGMIDGQRLSYSEWAAWLGARLTPERILEWSDADPETWIAESTELRDRIYPAEREIGWSYQYEHLPAVRQRLSQAGVRIAAWLDETFAAGAP